MSSSAGTRAQPATKRRLSQVGVPLLIVAVVVVMVVPLPAMLLDLLLAANLSMAVVILLTAMTVQRPLDLSVFPALLLITTLLRLSLNISSTRLILLHGEAGKVIEAFGQVVVGGNLVVGLVIFLILVIIQFVVITAGAGRVAEVAARFTLDAMPGKQMAIDADLNSGLMDDNEARRRRAEIAQEADFYGAMDGASKFVKGDAIAGIVIVTINLIGGFALGVAQQGMSLGEALERYALLSVGDGLVSQVPALLTSVAAGIVVTRVHSDDDGGLGGDLTRELFGSPRALGLAAVAVTLISLVPGLPMLPFLAIAAGLGVAAARARTTPVNDEPEPVEPPPADDGDNTEALLDAARVEPLELELAPDLLDLLDPIRGGALMERVRALRKRTAGELGVVVPPIRTHDSAALPAAHYVLRVHGVEVGRGEAPAGCSLILGEPPAEMPGRRTTDPVFGLPAYWVQAEMADVLAADGATVVDRPSVIVTHLAEVIRQHAGDLLARQDVHVLVEAVKQSHPAVAGDIGGDGLSLAEVQRVLRELLAEGVPIRDLVRILEAVTARARETRQPEALVEAARAALGPAISATAAVGGRLAALTFDPLLEQSLLEALRPGDAGSWLALDPPRMEAMLESIGAGVRNAEQAAHRPVLVCSGQLRSAVRRLVAPGRPDLKVLGYGELARSLTVEPVGVISLGSPVPA